MTGVRDLGKPLGNALALPKVSAFTRSSFTRIVSGSGVVGVPTNAVAMRVAVIGAGAGGNRNAATNRIAGGGGGGCAATKIIPAAPVTYSIAAGGAAFSADVASVRNSTASFTGYSLVGGGGNSTTTSSAGGTGSGGDYNYTGGSGGFVISATTGLGAAAGGGGAGPSGDGGAGAANIGQNDFAIGGAGIFTGVGWGVGGGSGGSQAGSSTLGGSGSGMAAQAFGDGNTGDGLFGQVPATPWGKPGNETLVNFTVSTTRTIGYVGGEMGGGGMAVVNATTGVDGTAGGSGGMVIEWFYAK